MRRAALVYGLVLVATLTVVSGLSASQAIAQEDDTVPPSGTYGSDRIPIDCTASACTVGLSAALGGPLTLQAEGPGRYHVSKHDDSERPLTCPVPADATQDADLVYAGGEITLTLTYSGYTTTCGNNTDVVHPSVIPLTFQVPTSATTSSTLAPTPTSPGESALPRTSSAFERRLARMSARQRESLAAASRGDRPHLTAALTTPSDAFSPEDLTTNVLLAGALVLLLVFPAELFNSTYEEHHERVERAVARLPRPRRRSPDPPNGSARSSATRRRVTFALVIVAGAIIAGFLDPSFGFDATSVTLVIGVALAAVLGVALAGLADHWYRRARGLSTEATLSPVPWGLAIAAVGVIVSRLVHFQPGYLYGLVGGLAFVTALERRDDGPSKLVSVGFTIVCALAAWMAFIPVSDAANQPGASGFVHVLDVVLAAVFIGGIEKVLFGLVPLEVLPGHAVSRWSWAAWSVAAFVAAFLFVTVLLRPDTGYLGHSSTASATVVYGLFVLFGAVSVLFWLWFRLRPDEPEAALVPSTPENLGS